MFRFGFSVGQFYSGVYDAINIQAESVEHLLTSRLSLHLW